MDATTTNDALYQPVTILNEENGTRVPFSYDLFRRLQLVEQVRYIQQSPLPVPEPWGDGVDSAAVMGMQLLFDTIPHKFPVHSILLWLREDLARTMSDVSLPVVEAALVKLARELI
jgi:hypothetical protein